MKKIIFLMAIAIGFCSSCTNKESNGKMKYSEPIFEKEINADMKVLNNTFLFNYGCLKVVDSLIVYSGITDISDKNFHVFSKNTGKYLTSFGNIGRAFGEISMQGPKFSIDKNNKTVYVFDSMLKKTVSYSIDKVLAGNVDYVKEIVLPSAMSNVVSSKFFYLKDDTFLGGYTYSDRFLICSEKDSIAASNFYPDLGVETEDYKKIEEAYYLFTGAMSVKPDGSMFAHATGRGCVLEIWENNGTNITPSVIKGFFKPNYITRDRESRFPTVLPNSEDPLGIYALSCTDKHIYAIYDNMATSTRGKIAVFDWKGDPEKIYQTSARIEAFDIDNDKTAYILNQKDDDSIELVSVAL